MEEKNRLELEENRGKNTLIGELECNREKLSTHFKYSE